MSTRESWVGLCGVVILLSFVCLSQAAVINLANSGWAVTIRGSLEGRVRVYNDTTGTLNGQTYVGIEIDKRFVGQPDTFGDLQPIYLEFIKQDANASDLIVIRDEFITNDTTVDWSAFKMMLGADLGDPIAGFDSQYAPDGDQFSSVTYQDYNGYDPGSGPLPTTLLFSNGTVPNDPPDQDDFQPGWASGEIVIMPAPNMDVGDRIVFKELPIPEPAALSLFAFIGLSLLRRKK